MSFNKPCFCFFSNSHLELRILYLLIKVKGVCLSGEEGVNVAFKFFVFRSSSMVLLK